MLMGSGPPDEFVSVFCMRNAALSKNEKTLVLASPHNTLATPEASAQMRRLRGPRGYTSRQDVLAAADMDTVSEEEDFEARAAYREATRARREGKGGGDNGKRAKRKASGEGHTKNGFNRKTG